MSPMSSDPRSRPTIGSCWWRSHAADFRLGTLVDLHGTISHVLVLAGFRDQGLGTALVEESERLIHEAGAGHSTLEVEKVNEAAIRLYKRLGYLTTGETSVRWDDLLSDGTVQPVDHPSWIMSKNL